MAFSEDVFHCSLEYGPQDARTSLGYFNLSKVLAGAGHAQGASACADMVADIWAATLQRCVLGLAPDGDHLPAGTPAEALPVGRLQLAEVVEMLQVRWRSRAGAAG